MAEKKKYIDAGAFREKLISLGFFPALVGNALENMPAADVVEVVRCRDCEYCDEEKLGLDDCVCEITGLGMSFDAFCSDGKRKEEVKDNG